MTELNATRFARPGGLAGRWRWILAGLTAAALSVATFTFAAQGPDGPKPPGDELEGMHRYGWWASQDVGSIFTDGITVITVSPQARGPLRLISARPLMNDDSSLRVVGVAARVIPDMLPPDSNVGGFQYSPAFPPTLRSAAGAVPPEGLIAQPPRDGQARWIEIQIGYEVIAPGRTARRGVELIYDYDGAEHKAVIGSHLVICAPSTVACGPEPD